MDFYKEIMFVPLSCLNLNRQWNVGGERQRGDPLDRAEICCLLTTEAWDTSLLPRRLWSLPDAAGSDVGNLAAHPTGLWDFFFPFYEKEVTFSCSELQLQMVWEEEFNVSSWHTNPHASSRWPIATPQPLIFLLQGTTWYMSKNMVFQWYII